MIIRLPYPQNAAELLTFRMVMRQLSIMAGPALFDDRVCWYQWRSMQERTKVIWQRR